MKLKFRTLWFDDSADYLDSLNLATLREDISGWGFEPEFDMVTTSEGFAARSPYKDYDLLVIDYQLEEQGFGADFIAEVRDQQIYTDIVFYSSRPATELWQAMHEKQLEGIYVAHRGQVIPKITQVGEHVVRKVLDIENVRGIVMAEVGDLDLLLDNILLKAIPSLSLENQKQLFDKFSLRVGEQQNGQAQSLARFNAEPTIERLLELCDSDKRWQNYVRVRKVSSDLDLPELGDFVGEVLRPRNFLAHGSPTLADDGSQSFSFRGGEYLFNEEESVNLRQRILGYKQAFSAVDKMLST